MGMNIEIRTADDWVAVYKNGRKVWGNHSCPLQDGLIALGIPHNYVDLYDDMDWDSGSLKNGDDPFPDTLPGTPVLEPDSDDRPLGRGF